MKKLFIAVLTSLALFAGYELNKKIENKICKEDIEKKDSINTMLLNSLKASNRKIDSLKLEISKQNLECNIRVQKAITYIGTPYRYGGTSSKGVDCSGLVCLAASKKASKKLYKLRTARNMYESLKRIKNPIKGALVFFNWNHSSRVQHVGIVVDKNKFIHASSSKGVCISKLKDFRDSIIGYRI